MIEREEERLEERFGERDSERDERLGEMVRPGSDSGGGWGAEVSGHTFGFRGGRLLLLLSFVDLARTRALLLTSDVSRSGNGAGGGRGCGRSGRRGDGGRGAHLRCPAGGLGFCSTPWETFIDQRRTNGSG